MKFLDAEKSKRMKKFSCTFYCGRYLSASLSILSGVLITHSSQVEGNDALVFDLTGHHNHEKNHHDHEGCKGICHSHEAACHDYDRCAESSGKDVTEASLHSREVRLFYFFNRLFYKLCFSFFFRRLLLGLFNSVLFDCNS